MASETSHLLVQQLCLEAGRLMENASVQLAHALPADADERVAHLLQIRQTAGDIHAFMNAAEALNRRANKTD